MGLPLGSQELADEFWRLQEEKDPTYVEAMQGLNIRFLMLCLDCPGNEDRQLALTIEDGQFTNIEVSQEPAPSSLRTVPLDYTRYDFRGAAPEHIFIDLIKGKIGMLEVLPHIKIDGDFARLMTTAQGFMGFIGYLRNVDIVP
jgi:hypothetical protein